MRKASETSKQTQVAGEAGECVRLQFLTPPPHSR